MFIFQLLLWLAVKVVQMEPPVDPSYWIRIKMEKNLKIPRMNQSFLPYQSTVGTNTEEYGGKKDETEDPIVVLMSLISQRLKYVEGEILISLCSLSFVI